jgi:hypothetical protein
MTSSIQLWEEDKKIVQILGVTNFPYGPYRFSSLATMAEVPQTFYASLSKCLTVREFATFILEHHHATQQPGNVGFFRPTDYKIHRILIIKKKLLVQHEALVAEVHHIPPGAASENTEPVFFACFDRNIDTGISTIFGKLSIGPSACTCSHAKIQPSLYATLWELDPGNLNLLQLAVLLRSVSKLADDYSIKRHNCFWFVCVMREILQDHDLFPNHQVVLPTAPSRWLFYRLGACLGVRLGIPTANEIQCVRNDCTSYFERIRIPII